jgi:hypothetical protein
MLSLAAHFKREIGHWSCFPSASDVDAYLKEVMTSDFKVRARPVSDEGDLRSCAQVWRKDVLSDNNIDDVTLPLFVAPARH